jgi:hypothetical protein
MTELYGRTVPRFERKYVGGYDLSGYTVSIGDLSWVFEEGDDKPQNSAFVGKWLGNAAISPGTLSGYFDNTADVGLHAVASTSGVARVVSVVVGIQQEPVAGDPVFCGEFDQLNYTATGALPVAATVQFGGWSAASLVKSYMVPWGRLLHANAPATAAYTGGGVDWGDDSSLGGFMVYHVLTAAGSGDMTAAIKVQDSVDDVNGNYGDLLSSGTINCGSGGTAVPTSGIVALANDATVKQWTRWQIALTTATSVTFVLSFVRNYNP